MNEPTLSIENICNEYFTSIIEVFHINRNIKLNNRNTISISFEDFIKDIDMINMINTNTINEFVRLLPQDEYYFKYVAYRDNIKYLYPVSINNLRKMIKKTQQPYSDNSIKEWFIRRAVKLDIKSIYHIYRNEIIYRITEKWPTIPYISLQKIVGYMWQKFKRMDEYNKNGFPLELKLMSKPIKVRDAYNQFRRNLIDELKKTTEWSEADDKTLWKEAARQWTLYKMNPNIGIANSIYKLKHLSNNPAAIDKL